MSGFDKLPPSWAEVPFDDAVEVISDRGIRIKQKDYLEAGTVPVIDQGNGLVGGYTDHCDARIEAPLPLFVFGDHTRRFKFVSFPFAVGADGVKLFAPNELWEPRFLFYQLEAVDLENRGYGRHYQYLRKESLRLPPPKEQTRIVEKLEELLSDLDAGVVELKAAQRKLAQYRQSLLKAAVEGALTADWRNAHAQSSEPQETGADLLQRILTERRTRWETRQLAKFAEQGKTPPKNWKAKYPEPVVPNTTDLPPLPEGWVWTSLDMLGEIASGVAKGTKRAPSVVTREVHYLRVANVQRGYLDLVQIKTIEATEPDIRELRLQPGDVLFNEGGDLDKLGRGWVWRGEVAECIHQNHVFRMRPCPGAPPAELISHWGNTFGRIWFKSAGKQTTNLASINMTMLRTFPVPLAPETESAVILVMLTPILDAMTEQESSIERGLKQSTAQRKNILKAAFAGKLVPQDPNDEPASALLERIRVERVAGGAKRSDKNGRKPREKA